ncbi:hypothetical protein ONE63_003639 [Megalurothrips usitatus]|uniref:Peroxidase-like n=1 Tax=Megalurothrips usitatus TaxID=439358 RepID=A0AAV7X7K2_9NEOP|nr:hypothetical protein ONE63_003639 [Megalurothrips usitatus]
MVITIGAAGYGPPAQSSIEVFHGYGSPTAEAVSYLDSPLALQDHGLQHAVQHAVQHPVPTVVYHSPVRPLPPPPRAPVAVPTYFQPGHNFLTATGYGGAELHPLAAGPRAECVAPPAACQKTAAYRTIDGSCNNLRRPTWGMAGTRYARLVPAKYADGVHAPAISVTGQPLPSARAISVVLFPDVPINDKRWTLLTMQWGQIMTHDMSMAMGNTQAKPYSTSCCSEDGSVALPVERAPDVCYPILIPRNDPVFAPYRQGCMNFVRSTTDAMQGCGNGYEPAEQLTTVTSFLDLSLVYGSNQALADTLRERQGGRLIVEVRRGREYPPTNPNKTEVCDGEGPGEVCYLAGDVRVNQNPQLTLLQVLLLREHNRLAGILAHLNPHWDDETLYQEARRINIAQYQFVSYYEYLPLFLGGDNLRRHGILYKAQGHINDYREEVDPSVLQGHATAAFRYFHSLIAGHLDLVEEHRQAYGRLRFSDVLNRPSVLEQGDGLDDLGRGLTTQPEMASDQWFTSEITDFLFRSGRPFGLDLRAIDVQRGRDHGLASYNDYRQFCGLKRAHSFQDFQDQISPENIEKLASLYLHPDDVDFTVGGSLERHVPGTEAGPTFNCMLMEQFYRARVGDRYFFESGNSPNPFSPEQLDEIRKYSLSRLFCDNADNIQNMQPQALNFPAHDNPLTPCDQLPTPDYRAWQEAVAAHRYSPYLGKK